MNDSLRRESTPMSWLLLSIVHQPLTRKNRVSASCRVSWTLATGVVSCVAWSFHWSYFGRARRFGLCRTLGRPETYYSTSSTWILQYFEVERKYRSMSKAKLRRTHGPTYFQNNDIPNKNTFNLTWWACHQWSQIVTLAVPSHPVLS
jgi:hypothetical protein